MITKSITVEQTISTELDENVFTGTFVFEGEGKTKTFNWELKDPSENFSFTVTTEKGEEYLTLSSKTPSEVKDSLPAPKQLLISLGFYPLFSLLIDYCLAPCILCQIDPFLPGKLINTYDAADDMFDLFFSS